MKTRRVVLRKNSTQKKWRNKIVTYTWKEWACCSGLVAFYKHYVFRFHCPKIFSKTLKNSICNPDWSHETTFCNFQRVVTLCKSRCATDGWGPSLLVFVSNWFGNVLWLACGHLLANTTCQASWQRRFNYQHSYSQLIGQTGRRLGGNWGESSRRNVAKEYLRYWKMGQFYGWMLLYCNCKQLQTSTGVPHFGTSHGFKKKWI